MLTLLISVLALLLALLGGTTLTGLPRPRDDDGSRYWVGMNGTPGFDRSRADGVRSKRMMRSLPISY